MTVADVALLTISPIHMHIYTKHRKQSLNESILSRIAHRTERLLFASHHKRLYTKTHTIAAAVAATAASAIRLGSDIICQLKYNCFSCPSHSLTSLHTNTLSVFKISFNQHHHHIPHTVQNLPKLNFPSQHFLSLVIGMLLYVYVGCFW